MLFNPCKAVLKLTARRWDGERPYWSYEDTGIFLLILSGLSALLELLSYLHLFPRSQLAHPGFALQTSVIVTLMLVLYLVLKLRYRQAVLRPLGWIWPPHVFMIIAPLVGAFLAGGIAFCLQGHSHETGTMTFGGLVVLGLVLGPVLEESFFRGCLLPVLVYSVGTTLAVILTALIFALFHGPVNLVQWLVFSSTGIAYGWIRVTSRSTTAAALAHAAYNLAMVLAARF